MCSRLHGSWTLARPPTRGQHTGMPCRRMPQKGVGHRGSPGLPGQGRVVQHDGSLHAQQGGQAPGHQVVQQDGAEGGRVQVQSLRSSTCPTPHSARCRASGPAPAQPRTPPAEGKHVQSRLSANSPLIVPQRGVVFVCLFKHGPQYRSGPPPAFVNKVLLAHSRAHLCMYCLWMLHPLAPSSESHVTSNSAF